MEPKTRTKRIALLFPIAVALVIYNAVIDGWASVVAPLRMFIVGGIVLVIVFRLLGWM